jgi:hypothetical protein
MQPDVYRKTGVSSAEGYEAIQADERTVYAEIDGRRLPLFVSLEHAGGYNIEGTKQLTERENVYALALPLEFIEAIDMDLTHYLHTLGEDSSVIVQTDSKYSKEAKSKVTEDLAQCSEWNIQEFIDPRVQRGPKTAYITMYSAGFEARDQNGQLIPRNDRSFHELYEEEVREVGETDTKLIEASDLQAKEELFDKLWALHGDKFNWLGKYHPVSMEEDEAFLRRLLDNEKTASVVRNATTKEGEYKPRGHGIMLDGAEQVEEWVRPEFVEKINEMARAHGDAHVVFYYGIASEESEEEGTKYAEDIMHLVSRLMNRRGGNTLLIYESTTMSSQYMGMLIRKYNSTEPRGVKMTSDSEALSQLDYWALVSPSKETV